MPKKQVHRRDGVYERKDRPGFWGSWIDAHGRRVQKKLTAPTLTQAKDEVARARARANAIRETGEAPPSKDAFETVLPRYLKYQKSRLSERSYERTSGIVENQLRPYFGKMPMNAVSRDAISRYVSERSEQVSPGSVVKELNIIKHLLGLMADEWKLIPYNPALRLRPPRRPPAGRVRYLQPTELRALLAACPGWLRPIAGLAAFTAMRRGEILGLRWLNVDLQGSRLMLSQTKNGEGRVVYLNQSAAEIIRGQWSEGAKLSDRVFPLADDWSADNVSKGFAAVCRRLEIEDFTFHDLRHTAASWMRMQGADIHTVAQVLGHKDVRMAARYQHLSPEYLGAAVGRLDAIFGEPKQLSSVSDDASERESRV